MNPERKQLIEAGIRVGDLEMSTEDKVWSRHSNDKVDIGETLARVLRTLSKRLPLSTALRTLSIGSSAEPQFRILQSASGGGLYLLDLEQTALDIVRERTHRQCTDNVTVIRGDYNEVFLTAKSTQSFLRNRLHNEPVHLITLHHSLYYSRASQWGRLYEHLARAVLAPTGAIHAVLMASESEDRNTTTWLYNHFAGKFCGAHNDQDLRKFRDELAKSRGLRGAQLLVASRLVRFTTNEFTKLMAIIWMILLYPQVHRYTLKQREEITEFIYEHFWQHRRPLIQMQDHLVVYRGIRQRGLV